MKWRIIWRVQIIQTDIINLYNIHVQKVANFSRGWKYILIQTKKKKRKENRENLCNTSFEPGFKIASLSRCCYGGHVSSTRYGWIKWPIRKSFFFPLPPLGWRYSRGRMTRVCSTSVDPKRKIKEGEGGGGRCGWLILCLTCDVRERVGLLRVTGYRRLTDPICHSTPLLPPPPPPPSPFALADEYWKATNVVKLRLSRLLICNKRRLIRGRKDLWKFWKFGDWILGLFRRIDTRSRFRFDSFHPSCSINLHTDNDGI